MIEVLFEDEDLIFINKPAGLPSQQTLDKNRPHVVSELYKQFPEQDFFLHHRLDKDTTGVMLLGKSERVNKALTEIFRQHQIQKKYIAFIKKTPPLPGETWTVKNYMAPVRETNKNRMRMVVVKKGGWPAETHFKKINETADFYVVQASPITGRTHQIRVHLACEKRPILGDNLYGGKSTLVPRLMLHAWQLSLKHPITGADMTIEAPWPKDMLSLLNKDRPTTDP